jgi:uncharacterized DUF497 family protein
MKLEFDREKQARTLSERGLDFARAKEVLKAHTSQAKTQDLTTMKIGSSPLVIWMVACLF